MNRFQRESRKHQARMNPEFIQIGIVKDNRDPYKMGRLKVWIEGSPSAESNKTGWITCDYATPFGGRTNGSPNANSYDEFPKSYGFWAVPPDIGSRVFVMFINGRIEKSYWFSCAFDHMMNHQVPGPYTQVVGDSTLRTDYPVVDYDRNTAGADPENPYINVPLVDSLQQQNLLFDPEKGTPSRSARRQAPATVYGLSSPRGNHIVLDDGFTPDELTATTWDDDQDGYQDTEYGNPVNDTKKGERKSEGIVLRTRSGAQILVSESEGNIFVINRDGTVRMEFDPKGHFTVLADVDVSMRAKRDINFFAERDINMESVRDLNVKVGGNSKQEVMLDTLNLHHGEHITDVDKNSRLYVKDSIRVTADKKYNCYAKESIKIETLTTFDLLATQAMTVQTKAALNLKSTEATTIQSGAAFNVKASAAIEMKGASANVTGSSITLNGNTAVIGSLVVSGGGGSASMSGGSMSMSGSVSAGGDVKTPTASLNSHKHPAGSIKDSNGGGCSGDSATGTGGGDSPTIPPEPKVPTEPADAANASTPEQANDILVTEFEPNTYEDVVDVNPDAAIAKKVYADLMVTNDKSLSALCFVQPVTGKIKANGYWGRSVPQNDSTFSDQGGWTITATGAVVSVAPGYVQSRSDRHVVIDHRNGFLSVYRGINVYRDTSVGLDLPIGAAIGESEKLFVFEIRRSGSAPFGFNGSMDPGLFFIEKTGEGADAANKTLVQGEPTNPICKLSKPVDAVISEVVKTIELSSIVSHFPLSGSLRKPPSKSVKKPTVQHNGRTTVTSSNEDVLEKDPNPEAIDWVVTSADPVLMEDIKNDEGNIALQTRYGYYRNGKFWTYQDSLGYDTIGYGHLILAGEDFSAGMTEAQADEMLRRDLERTVHDAKSIAASYKMRIPKTAQIVLCEMVFQLGRGGVMNFRNMLKALAANDYDTAAEEMRDSLWHQQTPNRVDRHIAKIRSLK